MNNSKRKLIVVYVMLPLLILSFSMGAIMFFTNSNNNGSDIRSLRAFSTLSIPVSLISHDVSGELYNEMNSVKDMFVEYNQEYGSRLGINVATGYAATLATMQNYISTTQRMHLSGHGTWNSAEGPKITMHNAFLTYDEVDQWNIQDGLCRFIYLSACDSMGHDGILDTDLANTLRSRTSVEAVIGFKDIVGIFGATLLSQSFWSFHVTYSCIGGISTDSSYTDTADRIQFKINLIEAGGSIILGVAIEILMDCAESGVGSAFIGELLSEITNVALMTVLVGQIQHALDSWELIGSNVPGLYWSTGGGGGSNPPKAVID